LFQASEILLSVERSALLLNGGDGNARATVYWRQEYEICRGVSNRSRGAAHATAQAGNDKPRGDFTGNA
jgi:hypothetical protein